MRPAARSAAVRYNSRMRAIAALALALPLVCWADWPEFRGPTGQGIVDEQPAPVRWSETENVAWKTQLPGIGWSSPVIRDGGAGSRRQHPVAQHRASLRRRSQLRRLAGVLAQLVDLQLRRRRCPIRGGPGREYGQHGLAGAAECPPVFVLDAPTDPRGEPGQQLVSTGPDMAASYDPETGRELWRITFDGYSVVPRPVYGNGMVYLTTGFYTPMLLAIRADGQGDVTATHIAW